MPPSPQSDSSSLKASTVQDETFSEVVRLIAASREKALQAVTLHSLTSTRQVGATISRKIEAAEWGDGVVDRLAQFIARTELGLRGFTHTEPVPYAAVL